MRRLSMKNKRRKSETTSESETEENGGTRAASENAGNGDTQTGRNNNLSATRRGASKRRSLRGALGQKPAAHADDSVATDDSDVEKERENGEKSAAGQKSSPNKRRRKEDQKASTSAREVDKSGVEYEVEKLIDVRVSKGNRQFLVRWKGYGESADTWENEKDLNCPQLIEKFLANEEEQETKSIKTGSTKTDKSKKSKASPKKQNENDEQNNKDDKETLKEFEVEKIIEVRFKKNGTKEFLIRWKGFSPADDTWEPEKNLNCSELIAKFMQKVEKAKTQEMRELRTNRVHTKRYTLSTCDHGRRLSKRNKDKQRTTYHECDE
ncbi:chromobox protein homolog 1-like isoform X1 [Cataglyphis hispanica]|uniref:chromobox protein homolog 1-like isoform X1 n=1 Tax=Cataglyphis hispanica TaxID=1086592 RepID=UPI00217F760C|nr:chromobox protein homolog 1-like isoform X1 [Cataglyphis hispanica]XP_050459756.1 chromobox protein homolog 1-like isoform X1 [Cataglyphis hispanica]